MTGEHVRVRPVRVKFHDATLGADVLRTLGHRAESDAGWRGKVRRHRRTALLDARTYRDAPTDNAA